MADSVRYYSVPKNFQLSESDVAAVNLTKQEMCNCLIQRLGQLNVSLLEVCIVVNDVIIHTQVSA